MARKANKNKVIELSIKLGFLNGEESQDYLQTHYETI